MLSEIEVSTNAFKSNNINKFTNERIAKYNNKKKSIDNSPLN